MGLVLADSYDRIRNLATNTAALRLPESGILARRPEKNPYAIALAELPGNGKDGIEAGWSVATSRRGLPARPGRVVKKLGQGQGEVGEQGRGQRVGGGEGGTLPVDAIVS